MREAPPHLQPQRAPPHPAQPICAVSGAKFSGAVLQPSMSPHVLNEAAVESHVCLAADRAGDALWNLPQCPIAHHLCALWLELHGIDTRSFTKVLFCSTCAAGLPAKYRHARTGMPCATLQAYAQIERHAGGAHAAASAAGQQRFDGIAGPGER